MSRSKKSILKFGIGRSAFVALCILLVCLLAGVSAGHLHSLPGAETSLVQSSAPCELCAVAYQNALGIAFYLFALHLVQQLTPTPSDPKSKSQFAGSSIFFRPPPAFS